MSTNEFSGEVDIILAALQELSDEFRADHDDSDSATLAALKAGKVIGVSDAMHTIRLMVIARANHPAVWTTDDFDAAAEQAMALVRESNVRDIHTGSVIA